MLTPNARRLHTFAKANLERWCKGEAAYSVGPTVITACTPYASYTHLSDPRIAGDGYDLICAGGIYRKANFEARTAGCYNAAPLHGEFVKVDISYVWEPRDRVLSFSEASDDDDREGDGTAQVARTTGNRTAGGEP